ncbi:MAG: glycosyltransferase [Desulfomonilaceae bacterium]|nr:glycosyltransferase [Desulfomonilaceae bacterium]
MRIAILSPPARRIPRRNGGSREELVVSLTQRLADHGVDVTLFASEDSGTSRRLDTARRGLDEDYCDREESAVSQCLHLGELFERAGEFDLIHNHSDHVPLSYAGLISTPVLTTIYDPISETTLPVYKKYNGKTYYASVSDSHRTPGLTYVATVYPGVDPASFPFRETCADYLVYLGPIDEAHGTREAIETAERADRPLLIAGTVDDEPYFEAQIRPLLDGSRVKYEGEVGPEIRIRILRNALALLYPVRVDEPFAITAVEANACGTPVIATRRGSLPEIIADGVNGYLVNGVSRAVQAVNRIESISRAACRKIAEERFSVDRMAVDYIKVYSRIPDLNTREDHRPWGYYEVLSDRADHKIKRIVVYPGKRLSLQRHRRRAERWTIVNGTPIVTRFEEEIQLSPGQSIEIPRGAEHRIFNPGDAPVVFIEVQVGDYFGEDDIERIEDDFGRM